MAEMTDLPFQSSSVLEVDRMLDQAENLSLGLVSMVSDNLQRMEKPDQISNPIFEAALKDAAATAIIGSYETTTLALMTFALAMVLYPEV
ncbi:hypothetical protein EDD22DRAFT_954368 [Suillus occidentalis]|nr:hypothetical protein EDD22DRAFT_954368 [Suillus occidentalis]